jgi:hypothetical protein
MFKSLRKNLAVVISGIALLAVPMVTPVMASAADNIDIKGNLGCGSNLNTGTGDCGTSQGTTKVNDTIRLIINIFSAVVGIISVIMIIFGGFRYITSGGDSGNVSSAKNTILFAIVGLVIVGLAQFIVQFVLDKVVTS